MSPGPQIPTTTRYEFIVHTGVEDASAKQKLKTVRSHVMRNYLHQQQLQSGHSSDSAVSERRHSKQRARSYRSASRDTNTSTSSNTTTNPRARSAPGHAELLQSTFRAAPSRVNKDPALDYVPPPDVVSCLAQLYSTCIMRDKEAGLPKPSFDTLNAKGETMRVVQEMLDMRANDFPETVLFAISILAYGSGASQEWNEASGHLEALQQLVEGRGGMHTLSFDLQRALACSSYFIEAELLLPPHFPPPLYPQAEPFSLAFQDDAQIRAWRTVKRLPKNTSFVFDIVLRLHQLSLALSSEWTDKLDKRALSNLYFEALHSTLLVQLEEPWQARISSGTQFQESTTMFKIWAAGLPIFVLAAIRQSRSPEDKSILRYYHGPILGRIQAILENNNSYHAWPRGRNLEPILITLFYAVETCARNDPWRTWGIYTMRKVSDLLKFKSVNEFRKVLEFFPYTETYQNMVDEVWMQMQALSEQISPSCVSQVFG